jgi:hypothetical protein
MEAEETRLFAARREGEAAAYEKYRSQLMEYDNMKRRLAELEELRTTDSVRIKRLYEGELLTVQQRMEEIQAAQASLVATSVSQQIGAIRAELELEKVKELSALREKLAVSAVVSEAYEAMKKNVDAITAELMTYKEATATKSSHAIGKAGEKTIYDMLISDAVTRFPYSEVTNMATVKHKGDIHMVTYGPGGRRVKIMIDVKNYTKVVQKSEVEKLYSDMDGDDDTDAGLLISLNTTIVGKQQFNIGTSGSGKPCLFLTFDTVDDGLRHEILCWAISALVEVATARDRKGQDKMMTDIQTFVGEMSEMMKELDSCLKANATVMDSLSAMKDRFVKLLKSFTGTAPETPSVSGVGIARCRAKLGNGKQCSQNRMTTGELCYRHRREKTAGKTVELFSATEVVELEPA